MRSLFRGSDAIKPDDTFVMEAVAAAEGMTQDDDRPKIDEEEKSNTTPRAVTRKSIPIFLSPMAKNYPLFGGMPLACGIFV